MKTCTQTPRRLLRKHPNRLPNRRLGRSLLAALGAALLFTPALAEAKPWKGAEAITRQTFRYGAFEGRIRAARGSGLVTPFFLWKDGSELPGARWQEMDFEIFGRDGGFQSQLMTPGVGGEVRTQHVVYHFLPNPAYDYYYTYRMEWTPDHLAFYVDGQLIRWETDPVEYAKLLDPAQAEPMQLRVSVWADDAPWSGSFDPSAVPAATFVNWIRVYSYTPGSGPGGSDFTPLWRDDFNSFDGGRWWLANWTFDAAISDYIPQNAATRSGALVLAFTNESGTGVFPTVPADAGPAPSHANLPGLLHGESPTRFEDLTPGNSGDVTCGSSDLDVQLTDDLNAGVCNLGWTQAGEWVEYDVQVGSTTELDLLLRVSSDVPNSYLHVEVDGVDVSGPLSVPADGWMNFSDVVLPGLNIPSGSHTVRVVFDTGWVNLNYLEFVDTNRIPGNGVPIPALIQAEDFRRYSDGTPGNYGTPNCGAVDVDAQTTADPRGGRCNIGWTTPDEWLEYDVEVAQAGNFDLSLRLASDLPDNSLHVEIDGVDVTGPITITPQGWQTYEDVVLADIPLSAGAHVVRLAFDAANLNVNYFSFQRGTPICTPRLVTYEAESAAVSKSTGGAVSGGWNLWSNGSASTVHTFQGGDSIVRVSARGQQAASVWPHMVVRAGTTTIGDVYVNATTFTPYEFYYTAPAGSAAITVTFDNDFYQNGQDRNLYLDSISVEECP